MNCMLVLACAESLQCRDVGNETDDDNVSKHVSINKRSKGKISVDMEHSVLVEYIDFTSRL